MSRGGARLNAGRRSTWESGCSFEQTKVIRVPKAIASEVLKIAREIDGMATDKPKVSAYVPQLVKDRLKKFAEDRGLSESQAVTAILSEYFGLEQDLGNGFTVGGVTLARMEALEKSLYQIQARLDEAPIKKDPLNDIFERHYGNGGRRKS